MKKILYTFVVTVICTVSLSAPVRVSATACPVAIRQAMNGTGAEYYDTCSGKSIQFIGMNYQKFTTDVIQITFRVGDYSHAESAAVLAPIHNLGYNSVRVVIGENQVINTDGTAINTEYISNVVDFLNLAKDDHIYVLLVECMLPAVGTWRPSTSVNFEAFAYNDYLLAPGFAETKAAFMTAIIQEMVNQNAPFDIVMGIQIENEPLFALAKRPFTVNGPVVAANGQTYTMPGQKVTLIDDNMVYYMNTVRTAIRAVVPDMLVGMALTPPGAQALDGNYGQTAGVINNSQADFFGVHIYYPNANYSFDNEISSLGMTGNTKPLILSEFGAYKGFYPTISAATSAMIATEVRTCSKWNLRGWFFYDWNGYNSNPVANLWRATEVNNTIANALAPVNRPDPCQTTRPNIYGHVDGITSQGVVTGWVADTDTLGPVTVNFWEGYSNLRGYVSIRFDRPDLLLLYPWMPPQQFGWMWPAPRSMLIDGQSHSVMVWAADRRPDGAYDSFLISTIAIP
jgi:hypothetical protein